MKKKVIPLNRILEIIQNILAELLNYILLFELEYVLMKDFVRKDANVADFLLLVIVPLFLYLVREKCRKLSVFLFMHLLPLILISIFYHGILTQKIVIICVTIFCILISLAKRINANKWGMEVLNPALAVGMTFFLYIIDKTQAHQGCTTFLLRIIIIFMTGYLVYYYIKQFNQYMDLNNRSQDSIPLNHVFRSSAGMALLFTLIMGTATLFGTDEILMNRLYLLLESVFLSVCNFFSGMAPEMKLRIPSDNTYSSAARKLVGSISRSGGSTILGKILDILFSVFGTALIYAILIAFAITTVKIIRTGFAKHQKNKYTSNTLQEDKVENIRHKKDKATNQQEKSMWKRLQDSLTPEEKIRRHYRKVVLGHIGVKKAVIKTTARETMQQFYPTLPEAGELAELYEKARYSIGTCTAEDAKRAKVLAGKLSLER